MIGRLVGKIGYRAADHVLLDVGGVGYVVHVSERTLAALPGEGEAATLFTELVVREDLMQLFGFPTRAEKEWHRLLATVQGIGPRAALAILGAIGTDGVAQAIAAGDWAAMRRAPGIGPKLAQRIVLELKAKGPAFDGPLPASVLARGPTAEALSALGNLGYAPGEAAAAVAQAAGAAPDADTGGLIRAALRLLAPQASA